jgi:hypothetical protein
MDNEDNAFAVTDENVILNFVVPSLRIEEAPVHIRKFFIIPIGRYCNMDNITS